MDKAIDVIRTTEARRLEHEVSQLVAGPPTVTVRLPAAGVRLLLALAQVEWDRRQDRLEVSR